MKTLDETRRAITRCSLAMNYGICKIMITIESLEVQEAKVEVLKRSYTLRNVSKLRAFVTLANCYQQFVYGLFLYIN